MKMWVIFCKYFFLFYLFVFGRLREKQQQREKGVVLFIYFIPCLLFYLLYFQFIIFKMLPLSPRGSKAKAKQKMESNEEVQEVDKGFAIDVAGM